jgi:hypothetical protein
MIKIQESVPSIYYNSSRDFQFIGHLFDLVLNAVKTDADMLFNLPFSTNSDEQLLDLMSFTFGLKLDKSKYTTQQLRSVCSIAPKLMKTKGSRQAIELLCTALLRAEGSGYTTAEGVSNSFAVELAEDTPRVDIYLSRTAGCKDILMEILPYILPAGMTYTIKQSGLESKALIGEYVSYKDKVLYSAGVENKHEFSDAIIDNGASIFDTTQNNLTPKANDLRWLTIGNALDTKEET